MFNDFHDAWEFLVKHPIFEAKPDQARSYAASIARRHLSPFEHSFKATLDISVVKVNPENEEIDDDETKNTETRVWLECGLWVSADELDEEARRHHIFGAPAHDIDLDCGAPTFEKAICKLAHLVAKKYGTP